MPVNKKKSAVRTAVHRRLCHSQGISMADDPHYNNINYYDRDHNIIVRQ